MEDALGMAYRGSLYFELSTGMSDTSEPHGIFNVCNGQQSANLTCQPQAQTYHWNGIWRISLWAMNGCHVLRWSPRALMSIKLDWKRADVFVTKSVCPCQTLGLLVAQQALRLLISLKNSKHSISAHKMHLCTFICFGNRSLGQIHSAHIFPFLTCYQLVDFGRSWLIHLWGPNTSRYIVSK